jgi:hypothetical protein
VETASSVVDAQASGFEDPQPKQPEQAHQREVELTVRVSGRRQ